MSRETTDRSREHPGGKCPAMDCCDPQKLAEMMARCCEAREGDCCDMLQKMMKEGCCRPQQK